MKRSECQRTEICAQLKGCKQMRQKKKEKGFQFSYKKENEIEVQWEKGDL